MNKSLMEILHDQNLKVGYLETVVRGGEITAGRIKKKNERLQSLLLGEPHGHHIPQAKNHSSRLLALKADVKGCKLLTGEGMWN